MIAANHAKSQDGEENILRFLQNWWSEYYTLPLKHPILLSYTFEELMYEFYSKSERKRAVVDSIEAENDKIEIESWDEAEAWADEEERKELEQLEEQKNNAAAESLGMTGQTQEDESYDPNADPEAVKWMERHMEEAKVEFGEDFGEDLSFDMKDK